MILFCLDRSSGGLVLVGGGRKVELNSLELESRNTVKRQKATCKKKGALGKWQGAKGKIFKRETSDVKIVARGKARHRVRQGTPMQSNGSQGVLSI